MGETQKSYYPVGSYVYCTECDINLYETRFPLQSGDMITKSIFKPIHPQTFGQQHEPITCHQCGNWVQFKLRRQPVGV